MLQAFSWWMLILSWIILVPVQVWGSNQKTTTVITSSSLVASSEDNQATFRGNVKMVQEELVVHSDLMIVHFKEKNAASATDRPSQASESGKEIRFIEAKGNVKIAKGESRAKCERAIYDKQKEIVILRGSPVAWQGGTRISGPKMTMFLNENRSVVEGGTRVTIQQFDDTQ